MQIHAKSGHKIKRSCQCHAKMRKGRSLIVCNSLSSDKGPKSTAVEQLANTKVLSKRQLLSARRSATRLYEASSCVNPGNRLKGLRSDSWGESEMSRHSSSGSSGIAASSVLEQGLTVTPTMTSLPFKATSWCSCSALIEWTCHHHD